jgi:hypothetical protein
MTHMDAYHVWVSEAGAQSLVLNTSNACPYVVGMALQLMRLKRPSCTAHAVSQGVGPGVHVLLKCTITMSYVSWVHVASSNKVVVSSAGRGTTPRWDATRGAIVNEAIKIEPEIEPDLCVRTG